MTDGAALAALWHDEIKAVLRLCHHHGQYHQLQCAGPLAAPLSQLVGDDDANALLSNLGGQDYLASLGPLVNLARVTRGEIEPRRVHGAIRASQPQRLRAGAPAAAGDPTWLDRQLADFAQAPFDVEAALERQRARFAEAWERFYERYPRKVKKVQRESPATAAQRARQQGSAL